ncbi:MAG TPA: molybdopterin-dependent oxidoreductase [Candidatus Limnocylindrales bacterium]|nr:molybdopterin-dependent oxidoreductase [Candidatus Limnocylindrales bacterium]
MLGPRWMWGLAGVAAAAVAIGAAELSAALLGGSSIIVAVGNLVISLQPPGAKDLMVALFGTNDKLALEIMVLIGGLLLGGVLGLMARSDMRSAMAGFAVFGVVGIFLVLQDPLANLLPSVASAVIAVVAGVATLAWLGRMIDRLFRPRPGDAGLEPITTDAAPSPPGQPFARRSFLALGGMLVAAGGVFAFFGRYLSTQLPSDVGPAPSIPPPSETLPPIANGSDFGIEGLSPIVVPNDDFYRIDTALSVPRIDSATWTLRIHGMVNQEVELTYADLLAMPMVERYITISCVSNEVGGYLVGNAKWGGVSLMSVLDMAGVQPGASQIVGRSFSWTCGFPTAHLHGAGREALVAVSMNGEPLPAAHGFPARLIVPGLYGYVSATKWLTDIELTTLDAFDAYWVPLGWAKEAPILTQSRIDVPRHGTSLTAGPVTVAGVAWAPTRGISRVETQLDEGVWQPAELSVPLSEYTWVQWRATVDVPVGEHTLRVRATDGTGETQTAERTAPAPDGARGHHQVRVAAS